MHNSLTNALQFRRILYLPAEHDIHHSQVCFLQTIPMSTSIHCHHVPSHRSTSLSMLRHSSPAASHTPHAPSTYILAPTSASKLSCTPRVRVAAVRCPRTKPSLRCGRRDTTPGSGSVPAPAASAAERSSRPLSLLQDQAPGQALRPQE